MGLLDSVLGAVINNASQGGAPGHADGGAAGGLGGLISLAAQNPQLVQAVISLLSNDGPVGGLPGLIAKFQQAGLGPVIASWLGSGPNQAISGEQLSQVLGSWPRCGRAWWTISARRARRRRTGSAMPATCSGCSAACFKNNSYQRLIP